MADIPRSWRNVAYEVVSVKRGDRISIEVAGGWIGTDVPADGVIVRCDHIEIYVPDVRLVRIGRTKTGDVTVA